MLNKLFSHHKRLTFTYDKICTYAETVTFSLIAVRLLWQYNNPLCETFVENVHFVNELSHAGLRKILFIFISLFTDAKISQDKK